MTFQVINANANKITGLKPASKFICTPTNGAAAQPTAGVALGGSAAAQAQNIGLWAT